MAAQKTERLVLAHYMVCCPIYGQQMSEDQFIQEMQKALAAGVDGFALNFGGWSKEPMYPAIVKRMFAAATHVPGFRLLMSLDFSGLTVAEGVDAVRQYANHPSYLSYRGHPVVSTFSGTTAIGRRLRLKLKALHRHRLRALLRLSPRTVSPLLSPAAHDIRIGETVLAKTRIWTASSISAPPRTGLIWPR